MREGLFFVYLVWLVFVLVVRGVSLSFLYILSHYFSALFVIHYFHLSKKIKKIMTFVTHS